MELFLTLLLVLFIAGMVLFSVFLAYVSISVFKEGEYAFGIGMSVLFFLSLALVVTFVAGLIIG